MRLSKPNQRGSESFDAACGDAASEWERLANGVILRAVEDYRLALNTIVSKEKWLDSEDGQSASGKQRESAERKIYNAWKTVEEIEEFFQSSRCMVFTELNMVAVGERIRAEYLEIELYE